MPRKQDDAMSESDHGKIPKSTFEIYRAEGDSQFRNKSFVKAIECYTQALELKPSDQYCLVNRSKCYLNEGNTAKALADAEESLKEEPTFHKGIFQKAEVLYFKGDFENALVFYHRGHKLRPEMEEFRLGIQKTEEAINNSVGDSSVVKLQSDGDLSYFYAAEEKKKPAARSSYQKPKKEDTGPKRAQRVKAPADSKTIKKMLGDLYEDREYLEKLLREESAKSRKTEHSDKIQDLCIEGLNYLDSRSEFWQQQKPLYSRQKSAAKRAAESDKDRSSAAKYVLMELEEIDRKQTDGEHEAAIKQSRRLLKTVNKWTVEELPNKAEVQANVHSLIGISQLELERYPEALHSHSTDLAIAEEHKLEEAASRAKENLGRVYAKQGDYASAVQVWEEKLEQSKSLLETTWLYHEISRCYLEMRKYATAKDLAEKALESARKSGDSQWQLNTNVLLAQCEVKLGHYSSAVGSFENGLDFANELENSLAIDAIKRAIADVNQKVVEEERKKQEEERLERERKGETEAVEDENERAEDAEDGGEAEAEGQEGGQADGGQAESGQVEGGQAPEGKSLEPADEAK